MKTLILSLLILATSAANAFNNDPDREFNTSKMERSTSTIIWKVASNVRKSCDAELKKYGLEPIVYKINACAIWFGPKDNKCIIITEKKVTMHILGHEVMHCFFGHWH
jgi:hypothetical protein